jgi:hypothetical protein
MDSDQLQDWISGNAETLRLHRRLLTTLQDEAEEYLSHADQPILTPDACRAMIEVESIPYVF